LPPVSAEVACGEDVHRITWRRGKLILEDHDLLAERSLTALGSSPPVCVEILEAWRKIRGTEQLCDLLLRDEPLSPDELAWRRHCHEQVLGGLRMSPPVFRGFQGHPGFREHQERRAAEQMEMEKRVWALTLLEALPVDLRRRLALSVLVNVARSWQIDAFREARKDHVEAALAGLALPLIEQSALAWRRNAKPCPAVDAELWLRAPEEDPACTLWADGRGPHGALSLPLAWFTDVWARGLALVDGCFVLEVMKAPRRRERVDVLALRWERRHAELSRAVPMPALAVRRGGGWFLGWT
jgi:hypothetical protein